MLGPPAELHRYLLGWFDTAKRDMPWRGSTDPYAIWLSETMLQQTQVATVIPYYARFLARFPTIAHLAKADLQEVLSLWAGLGYYRRAKHLHAAAQAIMEQHAGQLPPTVEGLLSLPGIGRYTAGAVASIAFGLPAPVVDGNVMRVLARLTGYDRDIADPKHHAFFWKMAEEVVSAAPSGRYGDVNQAVMELGATICTPPPSRPACLLCPVKSFCKAYAEGRQLELPVKGRKAKVPVVRGVAAVVLRKKHHTGNLSGLDGCEVLLMRRPMGCVWEGMWEFPVLELGNKEAGKGKAVGNAMGLEVADWEVCGEVRHGLTHRAMRFDVLRGTLRQFPADVRLPRCATAGGATYQEYRWIGWPLKPREELPMARLVGKIAAAVLTGN
jgi:A/G-specific adenine glycosylase